MILILVAIPAARSTTSNEGSLHPCLRQACGKRIAQEDIVTVLGCSVARKTPSMLQMVCCVSKLLNNEKQRMSIWDKIEGYKTSKNALQPPTPGENELRAAHPLQNMTL